MLSAFSEKSSYCSAVTNRCSVITGRQSDCEEGGQLTECSVMNPEDFT